MPVVIHCSSCCVYILYILTHHIFNNIRTHCTFKMYKHNLTLKINKHTVTLSTHSLILKHKQVAISVIIAFNLAY